MAVIEIHFTEHFDGETIVVSSQRRELLRAEGLETDMRTSLARISSIEVPPQRTELTFEVFPKGPRSTLEVDPSELKFLVVGLAGDRPQLEAVTLEDYRREPRGYA